MTLSLRKATFDDGHFLLSLRNLDDVRSQSKKKDIIAEKTHREWLQAHLGNPDTAIWILERAGEKQGYIRAQKRESRDGEEDWLLSIALQPSGRGHGFGSWALKEVCRLIRNDLGATHLVVEVHTGNTTARRLFEQAGFKGQIVEKSDPPFIQLGLYLG